MIDKLSRFEPKRIPIDELKHIKQNPIKKSSQLTKENILEWVDNGHIPDEVYNKIAKNNEPLPKILYPEYQDGNIAWAQWHIRGLNHDDVLKWKKGEISTKQLVKGHSLHCDLRMQFGPKKQLQQWVLLDNDMESYLRGLHGERDPKTGNSQKMLAVVKPSAEEPQQVVKSNNRTKEALLDDRGAEIVENYELRNKSFIIDSGDVGACLRRGAKVFTSRGLINIEGVKIGDYVYGHDGNLHLVTNTIHTENDERNCFAFYFHSRKKFEATEDHPFLVAIRKVSRNATNEIKELRWMTAEELYAEKIKHRSYFKKRYAFAIPKTKDGEVNRLFEEGVIVGMVLGDGYIRRQTKNDRRIEIYLNNKTEQWIKDYLAEILKKENIKLQIDRVRDNCLQLHLLSTKYINYVDEILNNPTSIFSFKKEYIKGIIYGLSLSDGNKNTDKNIQITQKKERVNRIIPFLALHADFLLDYNIDKRTGCYRWSLSKYYIDSGDYILKSFDIVSMGKTQESFNISVNDVESYLIPFSISHNTQYKDAYLITIWTGRVKFGLQREDAHEIFLYPDPNIPKRNQELFNGKYIIRCFKTGNDKRWWFFKSFDTPKPLDPIEHSWTAYYWPIPASQINKFGREAYRNESKKLYFKKLK